MVDYIYDKVEGYSRPTLYPGEKSDDWEIPDSISNDFHRLNSIIETKYNREYLKVCAFYNKMFPSLKSSDWSMTSYNTRPFTLLDQERADTGTGVNFNYLKQIVDQVTSRIGTVSFTPMLRSEDQSFEYIVYKDEVERVLRMYLKNTKFNRTSLNAFHNAAVVGYAHAFIDPYIHELVGANDYEIGVFESQFNHGHVVQMLYRDYAFPVSRVPEYLQDCSPEQKQEILEYISGKNSVDFKMYFNCPMHEVYVTIGNKTLPSREYPFDEVLMTTFSWDTGMSRSMTTSLFDMLYPIQREINKIAAKEQQIVRMYKGAVPVFNSDCDIAMKAITNGTGEALYIDSSRSTAELMTVINPTPLDPELGAKITEYKIAMYELAGIQNASFDMENMRSAAAVVALDQTRDSVFQAQLSGMADFNKEAIGLYIKYFARFPQDTTDRKKVDWSAMNRLVERSYIDLKPVHLNDPLSDDEAVSGRPDYSELSLARLTLEVINGEVVFDTVPYYIDIDALNMTMAGLLVKFEALGIPVPQTVEMYLISAFIDAVKRGQAQL